MKRKSFNTRAIGLLLAAILLLPVVTACQDKTPPETAPITESADFVITSVEVYPENAAAGETVEIKARIANNGNAAGTFTASLTIDDVVVDDIQITLDGGATGEANFSYSAEEAGTHNVQLEGLSASFTTVRPAEFQVSSLNLEPAEAITGEKVKITADITNSGDIDGVYAAILMVDSKEIEAQDVHIGPGETESVTFSYQSNNPGKYQIEVADQTAVLTVAAPAPPEPAEVEVSNNQIIIDFPEKITFYLECTSALPVTKLYLEYGTDRRSIASEVNRIEPDFGAGEDINTSWTWDMRKTGSIPPGAKVWWRWRITDEDGRTFVTDRVSQNFEDDRYDWQLQEAAEMDLYWHGLGANLINELTEGVEAKLASIELEVTIPDERKPKIFIYPDVAELRSAMLFSQAWMGAVAYTSYNIILIPVTSSNLDWAKRTLAHEVTHLLVEEAIFSPFGEVPTWLNEGLAQYAEGEMEQYQIDILNEAIENDELFSVSSLNGAFPTDPDKAYLAYAQSLSLASYLIDNYGWEKIRELLAVLKDGSTYDKALEKVYSFNISGLEAEWLNHISE